MANAFASSMFGFMARTAWRNAGPARRHFVLFYILFLVANIALSFQPMALAHIIDAAQKGGTDAFHNVLVGAAVYSGITLFFWALHGPARVIERRVAFGVYRNFVTALYRKVTEMPLRWHQDHHSGGVINRVNKSGRALFVFAQTQFVIIQTVVRFISCMALLIFYSWGAALASLVSSVFIIALVSRFNRVQIPLIRSVNEREHHLNAALYDYIGNIVTVLTLRLQGNTATEIGNRFDGMRPPFWKEVLLNEQKWGVMSILLVLAQGAIIGGYAGYHILHDTVLALGPVVAIFQYLLTVNMMFFQATVTYSDLVQQHTDLRGVDGLLEDHARLGGTTEASTQRTWKNIRIESLFFTHAEGEDALHHLNNISLGIEAGRKIALVGSSGSGKTTLLTLLRGLYQAYEVRLFIDGVRFDNLAPLAGFTTLVPQDSEIFENTVLYNLTLGTEVTDERVRQAVFITTFEDVVPKLPNGLATDIRERGVNLSGGQKQRLALARGLIAAANSPLLLLDEPTSSVDLPTEGVIFDRLFQAYGEKTVIAAIHRLHLLPRFDHIVLMRDGAIIEQGSFDQLMARRGELTRLWEQYRTHARDQVAEEAAAAS